MTLLVEKGTFQARTSTGSQTVNLTGSFQPKALILWTNNQTTIDDTFTDNASMSYGFSDGTNDACTYSATDEANKREVTYFDSNNILRYLGNLGAATHSNATVSSFNSNGFTLSFTVVSAQAVQVHYIAIGGTDITNVSVINTTVGDTSTGNHSYSGSGTTFTPDFALTLSAGDLVTVNTSEASVDKSLICLGAAKSTTEQFVTWIRDETVSTSDCDSYIDSDACLAACSTSAGSITFLANFVSFDNAAGGGITVNITDSTQASKPIAFLLIKGGTWDCGTFAARSGTGTQDVTITSGLDPSVVFLAGTGATANATSTANAYMSLGGSDGTREGCAYTGNLNGQSTFISARTSGTTKAYKMVTPAATASSSTINSECDVTGMATAGQFTLDFTTNDTAQRQIAFWVLGTGGGTTPVSQTSIHKYDLIKYISQTNIHKYNLIANVLRAHIHKYDILNTVPPQTSIHKYDLRQNILQSSIHKYSMDGIVAALSIHKYNLLKNIAQTNIHKYNLLNFVGPQSSIHKYNLLNNVLQNSIQKYNLLQNILQTSIHKYNLIQNIVQTSIQKYNVLSYILQSSIHKYSLLAYVLQNSIHKYNLEALGAVAASLISKYNILQFVSQTNIHKYNLLQYIAQTSIHKYNLLINVLQSNIHKYNLLVNVARSSIQKYDILVNVLRSNIQKYNIFANIAQTSIHKYNLLQNILQTSIHKYNLEVLGAVVNALIAKYDIRQYIAQTNIHKYDLLANIVNTSIHKYNLLVNVLGHSIEKYNLLQNVILASIQKYDILQTVLQSSIHKYDLIAEVLTAIAHSIHKYNLLNNVVQTSRHKYDLLNSVVRTSIQKYNILQQILRNSIHKYHMGGVLRVDSRHLYNLIREILGSSVTRGRAKIIPPKLRQIKYPVYHVDEMRKIDRQRRLRSTKSTIIPAFKWNIHKTVAPFVVTNPISNRVTVRFAVARKEPLTFLANRPLPIQIEGKMTKKEAQKAHSTHIMQQKAIEKYGKRLNKFAKLMKLFLVAEEYDKLK